MNKVIVLVLAFSVIYAVFSGNIVEVSNAAVNTAAEAIELTIFLSGGLMFWSGVMNLMKKGGITKIILIARFIIIVKCWNFVIKRLNKWDSIFMKFITF